LSLISAHYSARMSMIGNLRRVSDEQLADLFASPERIEDFLYESDDDPDEQDIEKSWHAIQYLLTGSAWGGDPPLNFLVSGPARGFASAEVAELARRARSDLRSRLDRDAMANAQIYPDIWDESEDELVEYIAPYFEATKSFVPRAAAASSALVVYLN
jgi:Domain of unknown function (DUF1877)